MGHDVGQSLRSTFENGLTWVCSLAIIALTYTHQASGNGDGEYIKEEIIHSRL